MIKRTVCFILAAVSFVLGCIGLLLPVIPQVPFFAACVVFLMIGSKRFSAWVKHSRVYRQYLRSYVLKSPFLMKVLDESFTLHDAQTG